MNLREIPDQFLGALRDILNYGDARSERLKKQLMEDPEHSAEIVANELGSSTRRISFTEKKNDN